MDTTVKLSYDAVQRLDALRDEWTACNGADISRKGMLGMLIYSRWNERVADGVLDPGEEAS